MRQVRVYTASKLQHAELWLELHKTCPEIHFTARWPFVVGKIPDAPEFARKFWQDDHADVARADVVLVYAAGPEEHLRGALVEAGIGIALGKHIVVVGKHQDYGTWQFHPQVSQYDTIEDALGSIKDWETPEHTCP